jgi:hypothetical protein
MSLDVTLYVDVDTGGKELYYVELYNANITHNLTDMAKEAGIYKYLWRPAEVNCKYAKDIVDKVEEGLIKLRNYPLKFKQYDSPNGWGDYEHFVPWVANYLEACKQYPKALIEVSR